MNESWLASEKILLLTKKKKSKKKFVSKFPEFSISVILESKLFLANVFVHVLIVAKPCNLNKVILLEFYFF
jgi:hypothetical protein